MFTLYGARAGIWSTQKLTVSCPSVNERRVSVYVKGRSFTAFRMTLGQASFRAQTYRRPIWASQGDIAGAHGVCRGFLMPPCCLAGLSRVLGGPPGILDAGVVWAGLSRDLRKHRHSRGVACQQVESAYNHSCYTGRCRGGRRWISRGSSKPFGAGTCASPITLTRRLMPITSLLTRSSMR